ncbi:hypothetical protein VNI00_017879 [Paramarasmius palmivorus]|uniref:Uncharacterized protein n=1 Tax=Paramarasmius palmivorus TaxID=297713 RepID=A0AAW0B2M2_9AGAR
MTSNAHLALHGTIGKSFQNSSAAIGQLPRVASHEFEIISVEPTLVTLNGDPTITLNIAWQPKPPGNPEKVQFELKSEEEEDKRSAKEPPQNNGIPQTTTATFTSVNPGGNRGVSYSAPIVVQATSAPSTPSETSISGMTSRVQSVTGTTAPTTSGTNTRSDANDSSSPRVVQGHENDRKPNVPIIVGSVTGGFGLILFVVLGILYFRSSRKLSKGRSMTAAFDRGKMVIKSSAESDPGQPATMRRRTPSLCSYESGTETETLAGIPYTPEKQVQISRTDRQMEIEERVQELQSQLISLHNQSRLGKSLVDETQMEEVRGRIEKMNALKDGDWAREMSDKRPQEMMR